MVQYVVVEDEDIFKQLGVAVPADVPPCGFAGEKCIPPDYTSTIIVVVSAVATVALVTAVHFIRKYYQNIKLESMIWRLDSAKINAHQV